MIAFLNLPHIINHSLSIFSDAREIGKDYATLNDPKFVKITCNGRGFYGGISVPQRTWRKLLP